MRKLYTGLLFCLFSVFMTLWGYSQTTYSFTTAGSSGRFGPTQAQVDAAYPAGNTLNGNVTINTQGIQEWVVPLTGKYSITAAGAGGGGANEFGGRGRVVQGEIELVAGEKLKVLVGQKGGNGACGSSGGGGGSFVVKFDNSVHSPVIVGGGGAGFLNPLAVSMSSSDASFGSAGLNSNCNTGTGGVNGNGGTGSTDGWGAGGGGYLTDGTESAYAPSWGFSPSQGLSFLNGGVGGNTASGAFGGFGGGGGTHGCTGGGGGGGGFSGGGGSNQGTNPNAGGGAGSYIDASMSNTLDKGFNTDDGYVTIVFVFEGGVVDNDQMICGSGTPTLFSSTDAASGLPIAGYQWQQSSDNNNWADINGAEDLTYQAPAVSQTTYYRRKATATNSAVTYSNTITVTVNPIPEFDPSSFGTSICNNQIVNIDPSNGGTIAGATYDWINDNPAIGLAASGSGAISFTTTNTGATTTSGNITVTPTAAGCPGTPQTFTLAVKPTPTVTAVADQVVCHNKNTSAISFASPVAGTTYSWTNSDPSIGLAASGAGNIAAFIAVNNGNTPVTATITVTPEADGCAGAAQTFTITVNQLPTATISGGSFCQTGSQQLTVTGQAGGTFSASAGLTISTSGLIDLAASTPGTYTVTYTFSNGNCTNTTTSSVTVNPLPQATISGSAVVCQSATPPSITFTGSNGTAPYTFTYKVNGGANQVVTTTSGNIYTLVVPTGVPGTYTYSLVSVKDASSTTCEKAVSGTATLTITPTPSASFSYGGTPYCATGTATPGFTGTIGGTYSAATGLNINATTGAINLAASVPGTYTVTYTVAAAGGCDEYKTTTIVTVKALTAITTSPAAQTVCERSPVSLSVVASGEGTLQYQWRKNGVNITGATAANYTISSVSTLDAGSYDVVVTGDCGAKTSAAAVLAVNVIPVTPGITTNGLTTFCQGGSVILTSSANSGNQWFKDGVAINGATAQSYTVTTSGNYTVRTTRNNCTSEFAAAAAVTVKALPAVPVISATGNILTTSSANNNQWYLNGKAISGATGTTHRVQASGLYTVQVTENGCNSTSTAYNFVATRIDNPATWNGEVTAYPNPVQKMLFIKNATGQKLQITLYDGFGKKVYEAKLATSEASISMEKWASGVYQLVLTNLQRNATISQTIIKL